MTDEERILTREANKNTTIIAIVTIICITVVCAIACMSMAWQMSKIAQEYFDYQYTPEFNQTQTINN